MTFPVCQKKVAINRLFSRIYLLLNIFLSLSKSIKLLKIVDVLNKPSCENLKGIYRIRSRSNELTYHLYNILIEELIHYKIIC